MLQDLSMSSWRCLVNGCISLPISEIENFRYSVFFEIFFYKSIYNLEAVNAILLRAHVENIEGTIVEASWANREGIIALLESWIKKELDGLR
jgi:hypothetical protein